jgi:hypothetical protein
VKSAPVVGRKQRRHVAKHALRDAVTNHQILQLGGVSVCITPLRLQSGDTIEEGWTSSAWWGQRVHNPLASAAFSAICERVHG